MTVKNLELEYKYKATEVKLTDFQALMERIGYRSSINASSWDVYYTKEGDEDSFIRFRQGDKPQLTIKRKSKAANNWVRIEVDVPLNAEEASEAEVSEFVGLLGYKENFRIFKSCFIYFQEDLNYVYYMVYDEELRESARFIEVEVNKDRVNALNFTYEEGPYPPTICLPPNLGALEALGEGEKKLISLGINPQKRLKKSLFEIYRKGV